MAVATVTAVSGYWFHHQGQALWYGDAEAHLNIARRIVDSKTPGYEQIGTVWLPLLHWLLIPLTRIDQFWQSGLAGTITSSICLVMAALFAFALARMSFKSEAAGVTAALALVLNPNLLYLASAPMTEPLFFACELGLAAAVVWFAQSGKWVAVVLAGLAGCAGTLVRYDGWVLLPVAALAIAISGRRWGPFLAFCLLAGLGPSYWLVHNRWFYSSWLEFYNGPYSAMAIQGDKPYPGRGDWQLAFLQVRTAVELCAGWGVLIAAGLGLIGVVMKRAGWGFLLLATVPLFYVSSVHSGGTPIFVPGLWPNSYYNTRYGLAILPLAAFCAAGLVAVIPWRAAALIGTLLLSIAPWAAYPRQDNWVVWKEAQVNSTARRLWTTGARDFLRNEYRLGDQMMVSFGDLSGILRTTGIPFRDCYHEGNGLIFDATLARPDLFLRAKWVIARAGDRVSRMARSQKLECVRIVEVPGQAALEIFRRQSDFIEPK